MDDKAIKIHDHFFQNPFYNFTALRSQAIIADLRRKEESLAETIASHRIATATQEVPFPRKRCRKIGLIAIAMEVLSVTRDIIIAVTVSFFPDNFPFFHNHNFSPHQYV